MTEQIQHLQRERDETARQVAALRVENERLNHAAAELPRLRAEVAAQRNAAKDSRQIETDPALGVAKSWVEKVNFLKKWVEETPEQQIPEFQYLLDYDWLDAVKNSNMMGDNASRNAAIFNLRDAAKRQFAHELGNALKRYVGEHDGVLPTDLSQLNTYFERPMSDAVLKSYKLLHTGKLADVPSEEWLVAGIAPPLDEFDTTTLQIKIDDSRRVTRDK